ncbi:MAG: hypothetical protein E2593_06870 [Stenotrophomonas sp.]|nr:hypothetical protein [Stenotrophomonas sp.]
MLKFKQSPALRGFFYVGHHMSLYTLTVDLLAKTGSFQSDMGKAAREADKAMKQIEARVSRMASSVMGSFGGLAVGLSAGAVFATFIRNTIDAQKEQAQLEAVLRSTGEAAGFNSMQLNRMADILAKTTTHSAGEITNAQTRLLSYSSIVGEQFPRALQMAIDQSVRLGENIEHSAETIGKALEKPSEGVTALTKQGFKFEESQKRVMKRLEETGRLAESQKIVLDVMAESYDGAAQAARDTFGGALVGLKNQLNDVMTGDSGGEGIKGLTAAVNGLTDLLGDPSTKDGLASFGEGLVNIAKFAAEATAMVGGLWGILSQARKPIDKKSYQGLLEEQMRLQEGIANDEAGITPSFGLSKEQKAQLLRDKRDRLAAVEAQMRYVDLMERAAGVRVIDNGQPLSDSMFKDGSRPLPKVLSPEEERRLKAAQAEWKKQQEQIKRYAAEAAIAAGTMSGPLAEAMAKHTQRMAELNEAMGKGNILQADAGVLMAQSAQEYAKVAAAAEQAQRAPAGLLATMEQEVQLLGIAGPARELYRRQLMNESDMREEINRAMEAGAKFSEEEITLLVARARAMAGVSMEMEEAARAAEDWQQVAVDAAGGVADTFADVFDGQIKNAKDFFSELKDVFKRGWWDVVRTALQQQFVNPIQKALQGMLSGQGFAAAGTGYAGLGSTIAGGILQGAQRAGIGGLGVGSTVGAAAGSIGGFGNNVAGFGGFQGQMYGFGGAAGAVGGAGSGFGMPPGMGLFGKSLLTGEFAGGLPYAGAGLGLLGAYYGLTQRGSGGMSSVLAGASYGALGLGVGGAIAGGLGAVGAGVGIGGIGAGAAAGATGAMGAIGAASWVPVVGWALAALAVVDKISGGKVFGTKYKTDSSQQTIDVSEAGGLASATAEQSRQKALFGGKKRRTIDVDPGQEARDAAAGMHEVLAAYAKQLGVTLRQEAAALVGGSFSQTYDRKGNVTGSRSTVLGKSYDEDAETFQKRLAAEQAIAAVGKIDGQASRIAEDWRKSAELLEEGANFFVTAAVDARSGLDLWTGVGLSALTDYVEKMQAADESLSAAYTRLAGTAKSYGNLMADIATQVMTADLSGYQQQALNIERTYRQQVKSANDYAKALGLSGARAEDLAKIEELRALQMGKLQAQIEADKKNIKYGLSISDLSPLTDQEKLSEAMQALADATAKGDSQAAQQAAQAALGFGRNLYASGKDYNDLYGRVTSMIDGMKIGDLNLEDGTSMGQLADAIEALPEHFGKAIFEVAAGSKEAQQQTNAKLDEQSQILREQKELLQKLVAVTQGGVSVQKRESLNASLNAR